MFVVNELSQRAFAYFAILFIAQKLSPEIFTHDTFWGLSMISYWILCYCFCELLPLPFIHFQYLKYNKFTELSIDHKRRIIIIKEEDNVVSFRYDQIKIIRLAMPGTIINGQKHGWVTFHRYHYALIETQDGHHFFITCLLINNLTKFFEENGLFYVKEQIYWPGIRLARYKEATA